MTTRRAATASKGSTFTQLAPFLATVLLFGVAGLLPLHYRWGASYWSLLPYAYGILLVSLICMLPPTSRLIGSTVYSLVAALERSAAAQRIARYSIAALGAVVFYLFHVKVVLYGDGLMIVDDILTGRVLETGFKFFIQPLTSLVSYGWYHVLLALGAESPAHAGLASLNAIAGGIGLLAVLRIARRLAESSLERLFYVFCMLSSASVVLFFGYPENYTLAFVCYLWTLAFLVEALEGKGIAAAYVMAAVTCLFHFIFGHILITVVLLHLYLSGKRVPMNRPWWLLGIVAVASYAVMIAVELLGLMEFFVPPWPTDVSHYWALAPSHLLDLLNLLVLVAPLAVTAGVLTLFQRAKKAESSNTVSLLFIAGGLAFLASFWIDPALDAPRDWDLLSVCGIPLTLAAVMHYRVSIATQWHRASIGAAVVLAALVLVPNVIEKRSTERSVHFLNTVLWHDPHYSAEYYDAYRCLSWGVILGKVLGDTDLNVAYFHRRLAADSTSTAASGNLGEYFAKQRDFEQAAYYYGLAVRSAPDHAGFASNYAYMLGNIGRLEQALAAGRRAVELDPRIPLGHSATGIALMRMGRPHEGITYLQEAYQLNPESFDARLNLGLGFSKTGQTDSCLYYLEHALELAPGAQRETLLVELMLMYRDVGNTTRSQQLLREYRRDFPNSTLLDQLQQSGR